MDNLVLLWEGTDPATMGGPFAPGVLFYAIVADASHFRRTRRPPGFTRRKSDFEIEIKILEKKRLGSAGCCITYRIKPKYLGAQELN